MQLRPFRIEQYYAEHEFTARYMLSSSDCESRSVGDLLALEPGAADELNELWCGYTESPGAPALRTELAAGYAGLEPDDVLVTSCAEEGIFLVCHAVLRPGEHAVVETPCYESALELSRSTGAEVGEWRRSHDDGWAYDLEALAHAVGPDTRLIYVNTPHNPTGSHMTHEEFGAVVGIARGCGAVLFCDEVYRDLEHEPESRLPAACEVYERAVSLGSMSKSLGLAGLRLGWLASRDRELQEAALELKHYTTICSSAPSELLSTIALRHRRVLLDRNLEIVRSNLQLLDDFFERRDDMFAWVRPSAGPIGFPRLAADVDAEALCASLVQAAGVLLLPGVVYDEPRHVRVGFGRANMPESLARLDDHLG
jgi:aspartate/methionine/tyrosine aminotransferase